MFKKRRILDKGEIATLITIGSLIFLGVSTLASSYFLKDKKTSITQAGKTCPATCSFGCTADGKCAKATSAQWGVKDSTGRIGIIGPKDEKGRSTLSTSKNVGGGDLNRDNRTGKTIEYNPIPTSPQSKTQPTSSISQVVVSPSITQKPDQLNNLSSSTPVSSCSTVTGKYRCGKDSVTGCYIWRICPCTCAYGCNGEACARQADNADHGYLNPKDIVSGSNLQKYSCRGDKCVPSSEGDYFTPYCDGQCGVGSGVSTSSSKCGQTGQSCCPGAKCYGGSLCTDGICVSNTNSSSNNSNELVCKSCLIIPDISGQQHCLNKYGCNTNSSSNGDKDKKEETPTPTPEVGKCKRIGDSCKTSYGFDGTCIQGDMSTSIYCVAIPKKISIPSSPEVSSKCKIIGDLCKTSDGSDGTCIRLNASMSLYCLAIPKISDKPKFKDSWNVSGYYDCIEAGSSSNYFTCPSERPMLVYRNTGYSNLTISYFCCKTVTKPPMKSMKFKAGS